MFTQMQKVKGSFEDAIGCLTVGQYESARKDLFDALHLQPQSRTAWSLYVRGKTPLKMWQVSECKKVFSKYGIEWTLVI